MSTAIATVTATEYPALVANSRQARIIEANLDGEPMREMDLIRVKTPSGGSTKWMIDNNGNMETCDEIVGLLVAIARRGELWPSEDPTDSRPVIVTNDFVVGYRVSDDLGDLDPAALEAYRIGDHRYDWDALSRSESFGFGSAKGGKGKGKRVKESRILAILREGDTWPVLVKVGPGSLINVLPFLKRLNCFHYEAVVGLKLESVRASGGQPYSAIVPRLVAVVTEEQGEIARKLYTEPLKEMFGRAPATASQSEVVSEAKTDKVVDSEAESTNVPF